MSNSILGITKEALSFFSKKARISFRYMQILFVVLALSELVGVSSLVPFLTVALDPNNPPENFVFDTINEIFEIKSSNDLITITGIISIVAIIVANFMRIFCTIITTNFEWNLQRDLSRKLLKDSLSLDYKDIINQNTSKFSRDIIIESVNFAQGLIHPILQFFSSLVICLFLMIFLFWYNFFVAAITFVSLGLVYGTLSYFIQSYLINQGAKRLSSEKERLRIVDEIFSTIKIIKSFKVEKRFLKNFQEPSEIYAFAQKTRFILIGIPRFVLEIVVFSGLIGIVMIALSSGYKTSYIVPLAGLFGFTAMRLLPSATSLYKNFSLINYNKRILPKLSEYFEERIQIPETIKLEKDNTISENMNSQTNKSSSINFNNVNFSYSSSGEKILDDFSLEIPKSSVTAIIGNTGSGKTTAMDLLMGLLNPVNGKISLSETSHNAECFFGYVPQETVLFDDTIAINITLEINKEIIDYEKLENAIKLSELEEFVNSSPEKYHTSVGQRGVKLSGGQIQRIGIARALYREPQAIILDEATSNLDQITEHKVIENITKFTSIDYIIMVAHRLASLKNVDKIIMLSEGKVEATGTYDELAENNKTFQSLINPSN